MRYDSATAVILSLLAAVLSTGRAGADVIAMKSGANLRGEVLEEGADSLRFRYARDGIWATIEINRADVRAIYREDGDQSDGALPGGEDTDENESPPPPATEPIAVNDGMLIAWLPLRGPVGGIGEEGGFDAAMLQLCFEEAERRGARTIVLDIESPGGLVSEMEAICDLIIEWQDRLRIIAWPGEAYSAAAIITMCCRDVIVRRASLIGAATIVEEGDGGLTALDAKMASPHYARQRQYMERSGHPYEVVAAMTIQEARLWWSPSHGLSSAEPADASGWREVDDEHSILTMTASDAMSWKIAASVADTQEDVLRLLQGGSPRLAVLDLAPSAEKYQRDLERGISNVQGQFEIYFRGLASINQAMIALLGGGRDRSAAEAESQRKAIVRDISRVRSAGRMIERAGRAPTEGRVSVPAEYLRQIASDGPMLSEVARALSQGDAAAAGRTLGEILAAWRDLTGAK